MTKKRQRTDQIPGTEFETDVNGTFHKVIIHSNFQQITWGNLEPVQEGAASLRLVQVNGNIASLLMDFVVSTGEGKNKIYYSVEEYYRVRYTSERMYLLD